MKTLLPFILFLAIGCGYDEPTANYIGVACKDGKVEIRFDNRPTIVNTNYNVAFGRIDDWGNVTRVGEWITHPLKWKYDGNNVIVSCPKDFDAVQQIVVGDINIRWGYPDERKESFACPCK